ncbi:MAG: alcohol dehydrogenase [Alicyclobacillus sp. RIFOXYA1_FULL_53_8]|nr:MAG: alcohol dehydrogenase [Alicyclobacillus sp. RIFOXYA1_FULL_53_8]
MFQFYMPTQIQFGAGKAQQLPSLLKDLSLGSTLLVVSDKGVVAAGLVTPILDLLANNGFQVHLFTQVAQNPRDADCLVGVDAFHAVGAQAVIAIGGGSAMDTAKAIALLAKTGGTPQEYVDGLRSYESTYPVVCLPTTAGTGSEVTRSSVITEATTHRKMTLKHNLMRPVLAVLDPLLTLSVPPAVTAATGVDALVHAIEGATCTLSTPITQAFGARAMREIIPALPRAVANGQDVEARTLMLQGSLLAGLCFGNADVAAVHCLAEALGGLYDTPHGVANAIFLPHVLRFNAQAHQSLHADLGRTMGFAQEADADELAVTKLVDGIAEYTALLNIPTLRQLGYVQPSDFPRLVELAFQNGSTPSNVRPISKDDYAAILEATYLAE